MEFEEIEIEKTNRKPDIVTDDYSQFFDGQYADFTLYINNIKLKLHKIIIHKSGLLRQYLDKDTHYLKTNLDPEVIKQVLHSLYTNTAPDSNLSTFQASMYLGLSFLTDKIFTLLLPTLHKDNILDFILLVDTLDYSKLEQRIIMKLSLLFDGDLESLSLLPLNWIGTISIDLGKVLTSDYWCVEDEFTRYESLKSILMTRRERMEHLELEQEIQEKKSFSLMGMIKNLLSEEQAKRDILPVKQNTKMIVPKTISDIYSKIIYTFMPHHQLSIVKQDGIIPLSVILESFWIQNESISLDLPNYRYKAYIQKNKEISIPISYKIYYVSDSVELVTKVDKDGIGFCDPIRKSEEMWFNIIVSF
ncbi:hypothetical protein HDV06_001518 [Boothiomyces sp. JEL0866]|nr:hypothetical protein HDV06_001518 [Boothiomyces sp. JEL0866]